jgi:type II secretory pathway pseudopilin PulG
MGPIEFLVALAVIGVVIWLLIYPVFRSAKTAAAITLTTTQAKQVALAVGLYLDDNPGTLPPMESNEKLVARIDRYLDKSGEFQLHQFAIDCTWNMKIASVPIDAIENPNEVWLLYSEQEPRTKIRAIAFLDLHARSANQYVLAKALSVKLIVDKPVGQKHSIFKSNK